MLFPSPYTSRWCYIAPTLTTGLRVCPTPPPPTPRIICLLHVPQSPSLPRVNLSPQVQNRPGPQRPPHAVPLRAQPPNRHLRKLNSLYLLPLSSRLSLHIKTIEKGINSYSPFFYINRPTTRCLSAPPCSASTHSS